MTETFDTKAKTLPSPHPVGPEVYDREYFLSSLVEGYSEYAVGYGISPFKRTLMDMNDLQHGQMFLDVGCGRGEILFNAIERGVTGVGIDYSRDAIVLSKEGLKAKGLDGHLLVADATRLPFKNGVFDRVFGGDLIEHLPEESAGECLLEAVRTTKSGGKFFIHTCPNVNFRRYLLPPVKLFFLLVGRKEKWQQMKAHMECGSEVHVYEYNLPRLKRQLRRIKSVFNVRVKCWLTSDLLRGGHHIYSKEVARFPLLKILFDIVGKTPLKRILSNDMYIAGTRL